MFYRNQLEDYIPGAGILGGGAGRRVPLRTSAGAPPVPPALTPAAAPPQTQSHPQTEGTQTAAGSTCAVAPKHGVCNQPRINQHQLTNSQVACYCALRGWLLSTVVVSIEHMYIVSMRKTRESHVE
eukprot:980029-Prorocentrum_minimum.AAC.1